MSHAMPTPAHEPAAPASPRFALACALVYTMGVDRSIQSAEKAYIASGLMRFFPDDSEVRTIEVLEAALIYCSRHDALEFIGTFAHQLSLEQKIAILLNMVDVAHIDGDAHLNERALIHAMQVGFDVSDDDFHPRLAAVLLKNDKSLFNS